MTYGDPNLESLHERTREYSEWAARAMTTEYMRFPDAKIQKPGRLRALNEVEVLNQLQYTSGCALSPPTQANEHHHNIKKMLSVD